MEIGAGQSGLKSASATLMGGQASESTGLSLSCRSDCGIRQHEVNDNIKA